MANFFAVSTGKGSCPIGWVTRPTTPLVNIIVNNAHLSANMIDDIVINKKELASRRLLV